MNTIQLWRFELPYLLAVLIFCTGWIGLGWVVQKVFFVGLKKLTKKTETRLDDVFIEAANFPVLLFIATTGAGLAFKLFFPAGHQSHLAPYVAIGIKILILLAIVIFVDRFSKNLLDAYSPGIEVLRISQGFIASIVRVLVYFIGILIILDSIGISVTPIIASLGIGSLAIALALQPTLENVFSGFQIILDQPIKPGDFIRLESGEEGFVDRIGWRSTWIRLPQNNMVIIPNKHLVNSRVLNYYYPTKELAVTLELGVHYNSDLDQVERIAIETAESVMQTFDGAVADFKPIVIFHTFADSSINFTLVLRAQEATRIGPLRHTVIKALTKRFSQEGIVIPYPIRAVNTAQEKAVLS